jgi:hypothetical protein
MCVCIYIYIYIYIYRERERERERERDGQFGWLKYFIYSFVLGPKYKQHIFFSYN